MTNTVQAQPDDPPWLIAAFNEQGVSEKTPGENPRIVQYHSQTSLGATADEVPWCSSFCCFVMEQQQITSTQSAASLSWLRWGRVLDKPVRGCIVIFNRLDENGEVIPQRGHCGFWLSEEGKSVYVLGGNQSNSVNISLYPKTRIIGYRWPAKKINSTTNMASVTAAVGTVATVAPAAEKLLDTVESSTDKVLTLSDRVSGLIDRIISTPDSLLSSVGVLVTLAALWYIVRERNKKIKRLGV